MHNSHTKHEAAGMTCKKRQTLNGLGRTVVIIRSLLTRKKIPTPAQSNSNVLTFILDEICKENLRKRLHHSISGKRGTEICSDWLF